MSNNLGYNDDVVLEGATDGTRIGNTGDRLKVESGLTADPTDIAIYKSTLLLNGSTSNMNVNGSVTPVNFDFSPSSGETWFLNSITILIADPGTPDINEFGAIGSTLTNGVDFLIRSNGTEYTIANFKNNAEITTFCSHTRNWDGALGWLNEVDALTGSIYFKYPMTVKYSTSDYIRFKIRDNLTNISYFYANALMYRKI